MTKNNLLTTLPTLPREWMVEFLFKPTNLDNPDWTSIFHMTIGGNRENLDNRTPAIFFRPNQGFYFASSALTRTKQTIQISFPRKGQQVDQAPNVPQEMQNSGQREFSTSLVLARPREMIF